MRVRPFFWILLIVVCLGVLTLAATVHLLAPARLSVQLTQRPTPVTPTTLLVRVTDAQGLAVDGAQISSQAWMTNMHMDFGLGLMSTAFVIAVQNAVPWNLRGVATASTQFVRTIGGTVGVALMGTILNIQMAQLFAPIFARFPTVVAHLPKNVAPSLQCLAHTRCATLIAGRLPVSPPEWPGDQEYHDGKSQAFALRVQARERPDEINSLAQTINGMLRVCVLKGSRSIQQRKMAWLVTHRLVLV